MLSLQFCLLVFILVLGFSGAFKGVFANFGERFKGIGDERFNFLKKIFSKEHLFLKFIILAGFLFLCEFDVFINEFRRGIFFNITCLELCILFFVVVLGFLGVFRNVFKNIKDRLKTKEDFKQFSLELFEGLKNMNSEGRKFLRWFLAVTIFTLINGGNNFVLILAVVSYFELFGFSYIKKLILRISNRETTNLAEDESQRSLFVCLLFCLPPFGLLGFHRFYCGKRGTGILWFFTLGLFFVGAISDFCTLISGKFKDDGGRFIKRG